MQQVIIGTKNQIVIPKEIRRKIKQLKPGTKVSIYSQDDQTITIKVGNQNWVDTTRGIAKKAWKEIDTTNYLQKLRNEWNEK